ncbi:hypothetical protein FGIG_09219 [Fasciola gigantica]|uniref:C2 DOCK-type domain-containing protein n=1 Tax=Fasciola gigantica TaxID=46835 RepID=A0A504ZF49_FASGI|nr:hypothetical protein FGIG_09219 [Fasciola gigantica]
MQFKLSMPLHITPEHHLFFRFYHVSVDTAGSLTMRDKPSGKKPMESSTGYAWLPLLGPNGNVNTGTFQLSIASEIQPGYLNLRSCSNRGSVPTLTTVNAAGDGSTSWLEGGKPLFTVQLDSLSSIYTNVPVLARFFRACSELAGRVLNLPPPQTTPGNVRTKPNRVTFREDPIEGQFPSSDSCRPSVPAGPAFSDCGRHLCSAIKGLWVIDLSALIHFLPPLFNQFMELILISAAAGHRWSVSVSLPDCKSTSGLTPVWIDFGRSADTTNSPNEILRTTIGTMSVLISELNSSCPVTRSSSVNGYYFDSKNLGLGKLQSEIPRHEWLRNYVKYAFDADGLTVRCAALHTVPEFTKSHSLNRQTTVFPIPLYHALVRGLILVLADTHCAQHILTHLFSNIWFPFALIVKSMSQWLCSSQKIKADRAGEGRFPTSFSDDLALLIKLIGSYLNSAGSNQWLLNGLAQTRQPTKPGLFVPSVNSASTLSAISRSSVSRLSVQSLPNKTVSDVPSGMNDESRQQRHTLTVSDTAGQTQKLATAISREGSIPRVPARCATPTVQCDFHGLQLMADTARFLCHLFNLMDRGYVMQRVRDLMIFLEILPRMPVDEIDRLNELRFQLINVLSQHEFFVQLNLPSLGLFQGGMDEEPEREEEEDENHVNLYNCANRSPYELCLTEQFRQEHFLVGSLLASIACLLAGCINTGSWATGQSAGHLHRQPLVLLRNLLAKHSLDPRYATSKPCQARITALYLPLIRLVLEHPNAIGSPGESCSYGWNKNDIQNTAEEFPQAIVDKAHRGDEYEIGGALQAAVIAAAARGEFGENANIGGDMRRKKRNTATSGTANAAGASASRPRSFVSDISLETLAAGASHQSGPHSDSLGSMSLSNGSGEGTHASGGGGSRTGGSYGTGGSASLGGGSSQTSSSTQSSAYLTEDGKVEKHILEQIAGLNAGGPLRRAQLRRFRNGAESATDPLRTSFKHQSSDSNGAAIPNASSSHSGSTVTLTGLGSGEEDEPNTHVGSNRPVVNVPLDLDEESDIEDDMVDGGLIQVNPVTRLREHRRDKRQQLSSIRMVDDFRDDPDSCQDWASQVLSLAGVFSRPAQQRPPLPEISIQEPPSLPRKSDLNAHR